ncbi:MAG: NADH-quinone oxidoreductase subunit N [Flectobacillus sp.]|uniref:NADH-quinone oxidoreductase subunit N n=1 Tax=Flectobacillus sp. TaxID=50419 RepID=UPI003B9B0E81
MTNILDLKQQLLQILSSFGIITPEAFLAGVFVIFIIADLVITRQSSKLIVSNPSSVSFTFVAIIVLLINLYQVIDQFTSVNDTFLFDKMLFIDAKAIFFKALISLSGILMLLHIYINKYQFPNEFYAIAIAMIIALQLMTMSVNLLMIYLAIEMVSLLSYILTTINKDKVGAEGGIKYLIFGATSSAIMLYGMSLLYGMTGTLSITSPDFSRGLTQVDELATTVAVVMTLSGFLFKLSATPFHIWTPDTYQAAPTPIVAFFSVAPKVATMLVALRFYMAIPNDLRLITGVIALATITFGNFSALWQSNAKRLLAYSTIAHSGFLLVGLVALSELSVKSIVFYLVTYLFANFAVFYLIDLLAVYLGTKKDFDIAHIKGLGRKNPALGVLVLITLVSLAGLPPTAGFFAKFNIFSSLWEAYQKADSQKNILLLLFIFGLFNTAVSLFFYLKIPFYLFFKNAEQEFDASISTGQYVLACILGMPLLGFFFKADWLMNLIALL